MCAMIDRTCFQQGILFKSVCVGLYWTLQIKYGQLRESFVPLGPERLI